MNPVLKKRKRRPMQISNEDVQQVVQDVIQSILGLEIVGTPETQLEAFDDLQQTACVQITGAWQGAVVMYTTKPFACRAAAHVFDTAADAVSVSDVHDSLAELINMIGGNIKTLLPSPSIMSLPTVTDGRDLMLSLPGAQIVHQSHFCCDAERIDVLLWEKSPERANRWANVRRAALNRD